MKALELQSPVSAQGVAVSLGASAGWTHRVRAEVHLCPFLPAHGLGNLRWAGGGLLPLHPLPFLHAAEAKSQEKGRIKEEDQNITLTSLLIRLVPAAAADPHMRPFSVGY